MAERSGLAGMLRPPGTVASTRRSSLTARPPAQQHAPPPPEDVEMRRRTFLGAGTAAAVAAPRLAAAQGQPGRRVLRLVPQADLALLDPIHSVAFVTRNHSLMVYDTIYGWDSELRAPADGRGAHGRERRA